MIDQDKTPKQASEAPQVLGTTRTRKLMWLAVVSIFLTVAAWIIGSFSGFAALAVSAAAIVAGAFALKSRRNGVRNTAITSIIAAGVLIVVISAFMIVLYVGMRSIT